MKKLALAALLSLTVPFAAYAEGTTPISTDSTSSASTTKSVKWFQVNATSGATTTTSTDGTSGATTHKLF